MPLTLDAVSPLVRPSASRGGDNLLLATVTALLVATAVFLRIWQLGNLPGVNGDEAWSGVQALRLLKGEPFSWRTPTGNPINVFLMLPLVALHAVFAPSFGLLRSVAVVSGLLALVLNYPLCRRAFDRRTAIVSTVLLAILPVNIAYSRFAWDASQSLLATVLVLYLPLIWLRRGRGLNSFPVGAMLALAAAIVVHPTNVFSVPLVVVPIAYARRRQLLAGLRDSALPARPGSLVALLVASAVLVFVAWQVLAALVTRLHGPGEFGGFCQNYLRLLSGATVYEYIASIQQATGPLAPFAWLPLACKLLFGVVVVIAGWGLVRRRSANVAEVDVSLLLSWGTMLVGFALVAGPASIAPHFERYGICLVAPGVLVLTRGLVWWIEPERPHAYAATWCLVLAAWLFPVSFYAGYFQFIQRSGGLSQRAFGTAAEEPKLTVFREIVAQRAPGETLDVVASEWWLYWPLEYLALGEHDVTVRGLAAALDPGVRSRQALATTWHVEYVGSAAERDALRLAAEADGTIARRVVCDYAGKPLISAVKVGRKDSAK
jgi:hypothetical protein